MSPARESFGDAAGGTPAAAGENAENAHFPGREPLHMPHALALTLVPGRRPAAQPDCTAAWTALMATPTPLRNAVIDFLRLDAPGKIVEHWHVRRRIPSRAATNHSMF